ncbi:MAG: alpha/beta fold hydrolase [Gemmatimonadota bacterium]
MSHAGVSRWTDLGGPVHYLDYGGPESGPVIVGVHGLGGAALNWSAIAPLLTGSCRLLAPDLAGHGLTRSAGRGTSVARNRLLLHQFLQAVPGTPVILLGNSMGGMISLLEAAAEPAAVAGLILVDPALPLVPVRPNTTVMAMFALQALPGVGRAMIRRNTRRWSPEQLVAGTLALCCSDPARVPVEIVAAHVAQARQRAEFTGTDREFADAARSVVATAAYFRGLRYRRGLGRLTCPVLLIHGEADRLVPVAAARMLARLNPSWSLVTMPGIGHVPQLEAPADTAAAITAWLGSAGSAAAAAATRGERPRAAAEAPGEGPAR